MVDTNQRSVSRRRILKSLGASGGVAAVSGGSLTGIVGGTTEAQVEYIAGHRTTNKVAVEERGAEPNQEIIYDTIPKRKQNKIHAQENMNKSVVERIREIGEDKDVELLAREFFARNEPEERFSPAINIVYREFGEESPSISFDRTRSEFAGTFSKEDNNGNKHEVKVTVVRANETEVSESDPCHDPGDYAKDFEDYIPGGVVMNGEDDQSVGGGTICAPFYDYDVGACWATSAHLFSGKGENHNAFQPRILEFDGESEYFGYCNQRTYGTPHELDHTDMATVYPDDHESYRDYIYGDGSCGPSRRINGARSNTWLKNNQSFSFIYRQGGHSGRTDAIFSYRPHTYSLTKPELKFHGEVEVGDSGGPFFDLSYDSEFGEDVAYICGFIARKVSGEEESASVGNTAQSIENTYNGSFF